VGSKTTRKDGPEKAWSGEKEARVCPSNWKDGQKNDKKTFPYNKERYKQPEKRVETKTLQKKWSKTWSNGPMCGPDVMKKKKRRVDRGEGGQRPVECKNGNESQRTDPGEHRKALENRKKSANWEKNNNETDVRRNKVAGQDGRV